LLTSVPAHAAKSYDNCTGFIDSVPASISTQGTWCLRRDVSTGLTDASAISIQTNNVTIDCNDFKIGGLAAGSGTTSIGISAAGKYNLTVRNCNVRGFGTGIMLLGLSDAGGGHVVEDNRLDGNTSIGIEVVGDGSVVRRNLVRDTGGSTVIVGAAQGIHVRNDVDVIDNTISGLLPAPNASGDGYPIGILNVDNLSGSISNNRVRGLMPLGNGYAAGIHSEGNRAITVRDNELIGSGNGYGLLCQGGESSEQGVAIGNVIVGFTYAGISGCTDASGNVVN
ncbi:MAG TPA: hypothetical protein VGD21_06980, partial [Lysobacter sp.]